MSASKLDAVYRSILITKFFTKGWGKPDNLRRLFEFRKIVSNRDECFKLIPQNYPIVITKEEKGSDIHLLEGHFLTPLETLLPGVVPECAHRAHFQVVMPTKWPEADYKPMCVHLAGTGDHFFWRRRNLIAKPLMKEGIGAIILENPFYGLRKPQDQVRSSLHNVSDIFVMGGCLILETLVLLHWCERNGLGPLGVTGLSMGGHMASLAATNWPRPLVLVPCLSWSTASAVFTQGVMSNSINWELLESQFFADGIYRDQLAKMVTIVDEAFLAGRKFAQRFSKHNECTQNIKTFNLPAILSTPSTVVNKFDITNPNNLSSCQGLAPETNQKYSVVPKAGCPEDSETNVTSLESLKSNMHISNNLYKKITSDETFILEQSEIIELNKLALKNIATELSKNRLKSDTAKSTLTESNASNLLEKSEIKIKDVVKINNNSEELINKLKNSGVIKCTNSNNNETSAIHAPATVESSVLNSVKDTTNATGDESKLNLEMSHSNSDESLEEKNETKTVESNIIRNILKDTNAEMDTASKPGKSGLNILSSFPFLGRARPDPRENWRNREALQFMRGVMDECTHLGNFSVPYDTSLIIAVCAKNDAYVPRGDSGALEELWPGAEVRYIDAGHVSAYVLHQSLFRSCVVQAFEKSKKKWVNGKHIV